MKLWKKGYELNEEIERYTIADDYILDRELVPYDCTGSLAHAKVLHKAGIIKPNELELLQKELTTIGELWHKEEFTVNFEDEDCHTAIENHLVKVLGDLGKKIHSGRSRNDQVVTALRLYSRDHLQKTKEMIDILVDLMKKKIAAVEHMEMPGYTHTRRAMPFSFAQWLFCFVDALEDDKIMLDACLKLIDQNPLGSGAGYGIPIIDLDRELTAREMGFSRVQNNPLYVQNSRGKFEGMILSALSGVMYDLNRMASDIILFSGSEFGFFVLAKEICTGSSIMPQKLNPDVLELMRAKYHQLLSLEMQVKNTVANLMSGYHRDSQLTKKPLMQGFASTIASLSVMRPVIMGMEVNRQKCREACTDEIYATEKAYRLVKDGMPFRDAYKKIAEEYISCREPGSSGGNG